MCAIITRGLYTFYRLFDFQKRFFQGLFSWNFGRMYGSRAVSNQERVILARVWYTLDKSIFSIFSKKKYNLVLIGSSAIIVDWFWHFFYNLHKFYKLSNLLKDSELSKLDSFYKKKELESCFLSLPNFSILLSKSNK